MSAMYFWDIENQKVIIEPNRLLSWELDTKQYMDVLCVDAFHDDSYQRYGAFAKGSSWDHIPIDDFPKEFRLHLLLLGVH